jgi:molybdenum cofactor cytidylyltransferase
VISALVLAAGEGTRFGGTKQLEILRGKPLVQYAVDAASAAGVGEIVVVLGHDALRVRDSLDLPERARFVVTERYADGQSTSLAVGLRALDPASEADRPDGDQPGSAHHVGRCDRVRDDHRDPAHPVPRAGPAILARPVWDEAMALTGDTAPGPPEAEPTAPLARRRRGRPPTSTGRPGTGEAKRPGRPTAGAPRPQKMTVTQKFPSDSTTPTAK